MAHLVLGSKLTHLDLRDTQCPPMYYALCEIVSAHGSSGCLASLCYLGVAPPLKEDLPCFFTFLKTCPKITHLSIGWAYGPSWPRSFPASAKPRGVLAQLESFKGHYLMRDSSSQGHRSATFPYSSPGHSIGPLSLPKKSSPHLGKYRGRPDSPACGDPMAARFRSMLRGSLPPVRGYVLRATYPRFSWGMSFILSTSEQS